MSNPIIRPALAIKSLRHTQYKNTAYAVAELIDNAIQAGASRVELICREGKTFATQREMTRLQEIYVLDNGGGMSKDTLACALEIGNGTRLDPSKRDGIGRFGMGLPMASISQCRRVEVWTWQSGVESAIYSYLDIGEIEHDGVTEVPEPRLKDVPADLQRFGRETFGVSGTLVKWSYLDKCQWLTADPLFKNGGYLIGRIYRRQLAAGTIKIRFLRVCDGKGWTKDDEQYVLPNDPLYLTAGTSCPAPFADKPMFQSFGTKTVDVTKMVRDRQGKDVPVNYPVTIRFAHAREMARVSNTANPFTGNPGDTKCGKHAAQNVGVSLMRADRELELEEGFVSRYAPATERWWGVEIEFPPALDEVFGVTHTKQSATNFSALVRGSEMDDIKTMDDVRNRRADSEGDPRAALFEVAYVVEQSIREMRAVLKEQTEGSGTSRRPETEPGQSDAPITVIPKPSAEQAGTQATDDRKANHRHGDSDAEEAAPGQVRKERIVESLKDIGIAKEKAERTADKVIAEGHKYQFVRTHLGSSAFFGLRSAGGVLLILLNMTHPAYDKLIRVLEEDSGNDSPYTLRSKLADAADALKLMLEAWARYEDELPKGGPDQAAALQVREDWGRMAKAFLADG